MSAKPDKNAVLGGGTFADTVFGHAYYAVMLNALNAHFLRLPGLGLPHPRIFKHKFHAQVEALIDLIESGFLLGHSQAALRIIEAAARAALKGDRRRFVAVSLAGPLDGAPLAKLAAGIANIGPLHAMFGGITEMIQGSKQLELFHGMLQDLVDKAAEDPNIELPYLVLIAAAHDHLVPLASAWRCIDDYPEDRIFRVLLLGGNGPAPKNLPEGVIIVRTLRGLDDHAMMIFSPALLRLLAKIYHLKVDESLKEVFRSIA